MGIQLEVFAQIAAEQFGVAVGNKDLGSAAELNGLQEAIQSAWSLRGKPRSAFIQRRVPRMAIQPLAEASA